MIKQTTDTLKLAAKLRVEDAQREINKLTEQGNVLRKERDQLTHRLNGMSSRCTEQRRQLNYNLSLVVDKLSANNDQVQALIAKRNKASKEANELTIDGHVHQSGDSKEVCDQAYADYVASLGDSSKQSPQEISQQSAGIERESQQPDDNADPDKAYKDYLKSFDNQPGHAEQPSQNADLDWK